jgi:hypothetical protein
MILPILLAASLMSISPLVGWFSAFWGIGIYQILMILISDSFLITEAVSGPTVPLLTSSIAMFLVAPTVAAGIALGGSWGIYSSLQTVISTTRGYGGGPAGTSSSVNGTAPSGAKPVVSN